MKIGVCVNHTASKSIDESFHTLVENGFDNCQLMSWDSSLWTQEEANKINEAIKKYGIDITAFWCGWCGPKTWNFYEGQETLGLVPVTYRYVRMQDLQNGSDFAKSIGIQDVITHAGFLPENPYDPSYWAIVTALRSVAQYLKNNGQNFLFETGQETPVALVRVMEDMGTDNVYINLDPANLLMYGKANPVDSVEIFGKYIRGVHAKDGQYPVDGKNLGVETAIGEGKVNFPELIKKLFEVGYDGSLTIEREIEGEQQSRDIMTGREMLEKIIGKHSKGNQ